MRKITLFKGKLEVSVYEIEVAAYIKNGWSKQKPAQINEVTNNGQ